MYKQIFFILILFTLIFTLPGIAQKKSITITTYYPAPYGIYREIRSQKMAIGDNYSDPSQHCWLGGSCPLPDIDEDADLVVEGNVGIGETEPEYKLDIAGALRLQPGSAPTGANGVIYYDSSEDKFKCHLAGSWVDCMGSGTGYWAASGNHIYNTNTGNVGIGTKNPHAKLHVNEAILAQGSFGSGQIFNLGGGTWLLWYPRRAAFRAGLFTLGLKDSDIGDYSVAMGRDAEASGEYSISMGCSTTATGIASIAMGESTNAGGDYSIAMGYGTDASGTSSIAMGYNTEASGDYSVAIGTYTTASDNYSIVIGQGVDNTDRLVNNIASSLMVGFNSDIPTLFVGPSSGKGTTGKVGIGTTTPKNKLDVEGGVAVGTSYAGTHTAPSNGMIIQGKVGIGTTDPGSYKLYVNGSLRCTSCTGCSTKEMKKDIKYLSKSDYKEILKKLEKIKVVTYRWKEEANADDELHIGVISEEAPDEIVTKDKKAIDISDYLGFLLAIAKAQQDEIEALKTHLKSDNRL